MNRIVDLLRRALSSQFVRFLIVGGFNTLFGYLLFATLILLRVPYAIAVFVATVGGILFNFKTYGAVVFRNHDNSLILRFVAVYAVCYCINLVPLAWANRHHISLLIAGAVIALPMGFIAFSLNRIFVFSRPVR